MGWYDRKVRRVRDLSCGDRRIFLELEVRRIDCRRCGKVKRERLDFRSAPPDSERTRAISAAMAAESTNRANLGYAPLALGTDIGGSVRLPVG
jgi:transposase